MYQWLVFFLKNLLSYSEAVFQKFTMFFILVATFQLSNGLTGEDQAIVWLAGYGLLTITVAIFGDRVHGSLADWSQSR